MGKNTPIYNTPGIKPSARSWKVDDENDTEEGEYVETTVKPDTRHKGNKLNLLKKNLPIVNNFEHKDSAVILTMKDRMVEVYEHLSIITPKDVCRRIRYMEWVLKKKNNIDFKSVILHWNNYLDKDNGSSRKL